MRLLPRKSLLEHAALETDHPAAGLPSLLCAIQACLNERRNGATPEGFQWDQGEAPQPESSEPRGPWSPEGSLVLTASELFFSNASASFEELMEVISRILINRMSEPPKWRKSFARVFSGTFPGELVGSFPAASHCLTVQSC